MQLRLKELRESKNYLQKDIAEIIGVHKSTYNQWENNNNIPIRRLAELADFYEINTDYLVGLTNMKINRKGKSKLDLKEIAVHLREIRVELNFSLRDIEKAIGINNSRWANYEAGLYIVSTWILVFACKKSGISMDYVLGRSKLKYLKDLY